MRRAALLIALAFATAPLAAQAESAVTIPPPAAPTQGVSSETAVLAGGCFWGVQAVFQHVKGVTLAVSGYAGGAKKDASYETVSSGRTGHAESVKVIFDPKQISYGTILQIYFAIAHDPTELNRQGPDTGTQYRSEIFPQSEAQAKIAGDYIAQLNTAHVFKRPIATRIAPLHTAFYSAEAYHQDYATRHPYQPYIVFNDRPKVEHLKTTFPDLWRETPVLVSQAENGN